MVVISGLAITAGSSPSRLAAMGSSPPTRSDSTTVATSVTLTVAATAAPTEVVSSSRKKFTAAKAADELLTIRGIRASFVMYRKDDGVYMSARSLGEVNVQVILEALGGGGNSTTAGGQAKGITVAEAKEKLLAAIDKYFED